MKRSILFLFLVTSVFTQAQTLQSNVSKVALRATRFWNGLFGQVYGTDVDLMAKYLEKDTVFSVLLPAGIEYYVVYEEADSILFQILNPIKICKAENVIDTVFAQNFPWPYLIDSRKKYKKEYKLLEKNLNSTQMAFIADSLLVDNKKGTKKELIYSKKEFAKIKANKEIVSNNYDKSQTIFYVNSPKIYQHKFRQGITTGSMFLPIKVRPSLTDDEGVEYERNFTTDISLGPYIGYKYNVGNKYEQFVSAGVFAGPSFINMNSSNSNDTTIREYNLLALTWGLGLTFQINKFQLGVIAGYDYLSGENAKTWIYDGKLWFSIGIGFSFFQP